MTVLDNAPRDQYTATGGQTVFPYTFEIAAAGDIKVLQNGTLINQGAGAGEYAVSGVGVDTGGNITLVTGATSGDIITIYRDMAYERLTAYTNAGDFLAADVNNDFDRLWLALQQNGGDLDRVLIAPNTDPTSINMTIPDKATRLGKYLKFNDTTGNPEAGSIAGAFTAAGLNHYNFTGDGSTVNFTLGMEPGGENNTQVYIDGVYQQKDGYNVSGAVLQFSVAPPNLSTIEVMVIQVLPVGATTASQVSFTQAGSTYGRNVQLKLQESVSVKDFGAVGDGVTDDTAAIQAAIDAHSYIVFPAGNTFMISQIIVPSNRTLEINGTLKMLASQPDERVMIKNSDQSGGNSNIKLIGSGSIDGNKSNQSTSVQIRHGCIFFKKVNDCLISTREIGKNKWNNSYPTIPTSGFEGCVFIQDAYNVTVDGVFLNTWEREGIKIDDGATGNCYACCISNVVCEGSGASSYSGCAISGPNATNNVMNNIIVRNNGASGVNADTTHSSVSNISVYRNGFQHAVNFGHAGKPASYTSASNISVYDAGNLASSGTNNSGVSIAGATEYLSLSNVTVDGAYNHGINVSAGAKNVVLNNIFIANVNDYGFNLFNADGTKITNTRVVNASSGDIQISGTSTDIEYQVNNTKTLSNLRFGVSGSDLNNYTEATYEATATPTTSGTVTLNPSFNTLAYTRIGRLVIVTGNLIVSSVASPVGAFDINLPLPAANLSEESGRAAVAQVSIYPTVAVNANQFLGFIEEGSSNIRVYLGDNTTIQSDSSQELQASSQITISVMYFTS